MDNSNQQLGRSEDQRVNTIRSKIIEYGIVILLTIVSLFIIYYITKEHWTLILFVGVVLVVTVLLTRSRKNV